MLITAVMDADHAFFVVRIEEGIAAATPAPTTVTLPASSDGNSLR
jgi:hypothetical protein